MVDQQLRGRAVADERVLAAMASLPREAFVESGDERFAYADRPLPIDGGQTISQPFVVARMSELLRVGPGQRVLEIGTGSGYQAAVLASMGVRVVSIERLPALATAARERLARLGIEGVEIRVGDGSEGDPGGSPWDGILVTAAAPSIPDPLRDQLAIGARLVLPVGPRSGQELMVIERRSATEWAEWSDGQVVFVPLVGRGGWDESEGRGLGILGRP